MGETYGYSDKVMDIFRHPHNMGEIKDADAVGKVGNYSCGDMMYLYLKIDKNKDGDEVIKDAKVKTFGCVAAVATSSVITDMIIGKTLKEALKLTKQDIVDILNGLPKIKIHCSVLAIDALKQAAYVYYKKYNKPLPEGLKEIHERVEKTNEAIEHRH
jgi:nitrogen fixation NifU-like protein